MLVFEYADTVTKDLSSLEAQPFYLMGRDVDQENGTGSAAENLDLS